MAFFERTLCDIVKAQFVGNSTLTETFGDIGWNRNRRTA